MMRPSSPSKELKIVLQSPYTLPWVINKYLHIHILNEHVCSVRTQNEYAPKRPL